MDPKNLSPEALAALAAGVELGEPVAAVEPAPAEPVAAEPVAAEPAPAVLAPVANELVAHLQASLDKANGDILSAKMEAKAAVDSMAAMKSQFDASVEIARASVRTMTVALGGKVDAVASMSAAEVLATHASVAEQFKSKFKAGPVAATGPSTEGAASAPRPLFAALLQSRQK
jgi:2-oxoglutarate dehydrogenase E2 component (dihydrolipoamide succinyltransferase)